MSCSGKDVWNYSYELTIVVWQSAIYLTAVTAHFYYPRFCGLGVWVSLSLSLCFLVSQGCNQGTDLGCSFISSFDRGRIHFQAYSIAGRIHFLWSTGLRASVFGWLLASSFPHLSFLTYGLSIEQLTVQLLALSKPTREREYPNRMYYNVN